MQAEVIRAFVERLQRDVARVEPTAAIGVWDLKARQWIVRPPEPEDYDEGYEDEGWIVQIHRSGQMIDIDSNVLLELAEYAQDVVIDETGKSWPDVVHEGQIVHLEPAEFGGEVRWAHRDGAVHEVGALPDVSGF